MLRINKFDMVRTITSGLQAMGIYDAVLDGPTGPKRLDALETAAFARELEYVFADIYRKEYPDLMGKTLIPVKPGPGPGAESHTYTEVEKFGQAKIVHNYATDFPDTEVQGKQFSQVIRSIGDSYQYNIQDLRAAALTKIHMPTEKADGAREAIERLADLLMLTGDVNTGLFGLNSTSLVANYNAVTATTKTGGGTLWTSVTAKPQEIITDVQSLFKSIPVNTKNKHRGNTLALDTASYNLIAFANWGDTGNPTGQSMLQYIMANTPGLEAVEVWTRLDNAGATNKSRIFAYDRNPKVLYQVIPQDFEQFPPQARSLAFVINCHMRWGGVVTPYPKAISYMDGTGA
jgi:hypothetical protein